MPSDPCPGVVRWRALTPRPPVAGPLRPRVLAAVLGALAAEGGARRLAAQTDYDNTDGGRPLTTEGAYPVGRRALAFPLAPLRVERARGAASTAGASCRRSPSAS
ncbi:hypothetical protein rosag_46580 [Roseisolibacter agri]|uniref:Uncharacterized protein n=1 Tax=Roseisolibacter agri TaxID=2014610 RepID=A0AA37Q7S4_9BACT|nr:hypothetical protein rosag_46580 [Roseisolibacter agri]